MNPGRKSGPKAETRPFHVELPRRVFRRVNRASPLPVEQPKKDELAERMRCFDLFAKLPKRILMDIVTASKVGVYRTGENIWQHGDPAHQAVFIESGFIKAARSNSEGLRRTYGLFGPGDSMGLFAIWAGTGYPTDAIALNEGLTLIEVKADAILGFIEKNPRLSAPLRKEIGNFTEAFINKIEIVSAGTVPERLAVLMVQLIDRYGVEKKGHRARLPISLTLEQLSEIVGVRLETVARALGAWKRSGWLHIDSSGCHFTRLDKVRELLKK
jgi:CRP-like cAMP-binding protein